MGYIWGFLLFYGNVNQDMNMSNLKSIKDYDYSEDSLDIMVFDETGVAILRRKLVKNKQYLFPYVLQPEKAEIVAKGITAFLFSDSYGGKYQLIPISWSSTRDNSFDISVYFNQYFAVCKKFYVENEKSKADSVYRDLDKEFIKFHINKETKNYKESKSFLLESNNGRLFDLNKDSYVLSYLKWIRKKTSNTEIDYLRLIFFGFILILLVSFCLLQFILKDWKYNYAQIIVNLIDAIDSETVKDFGRFLNVGIVSVIVIVSKAIYKKLKP